MNIKLFIAAWLAWSSSCYFFFHGQGLNPTLLRINQKLFFLEIFKFLNISINWSIVQIQILNFDSFQVPSDSVFDIQNSTGEIRTRVELDFETQPIHYVVVTAVDDGEDVKKSSTATVTVVVQDTADEVIILVSL